MRGRALRAAPGEKAARQGQATGRGPRRAGATLRQAGAGAAPRQACRGCARAPRRDEGPRSEPPRRAEQHARGARRAGCAVSHAGAGGGSAPRRAMAVKRIGEGRAGRAMPGVGAAPSWGRHAARGGEAEHAWKRAALGRVVHVV
jgi:hypothetical protein